MSAGEERARSVLSNVWDKHNELIQYTLRLEVMLKLYAPEEKWDYVQAQVRRPDWMKDYG